MRSIGLLGVSSKDGFEKCEESEEEAEGTDKIYDEGTHKLMW